MVPSPQKNLVIPDSPKEDEIQEGFEKPPPRVF
jgi:hypothetical protein